MHRSLKLKRCQRLTYVDQYKKLENTILYFWKGTFFALLTTSLSTVKKVPFLCFWEHRFQLQKIRYLFTPFMRSLESDKKVPLSRFKSSFGKVRNAWKADSIDVKIFSPESFNFSPNRLAWTKKVPILHVVLWKINAKS